MCDKHPHIDASVLNLFSTPARILVGGSSNSGKSVLCDYLVRQYHDQFARIIICGVSSHPLEECSSIKPKLTLSPDLVDPSDYQSFDKEPVLLWIDDLYSKALDSSNVCDLFTKGRHKNISTILTTQNIFPRAKYARDVSLNASHYILTRIRDLSSVETLARQLYGTKRSKGFMEIYNKCMTSRPFAHLLIDLAPDTPDSVQLRTNLDKQECDYEIVYQLC